MKSDTKKNRILMYIPTLIYVILTLALMISWNLEDIENGMTNQFGYEKGNWFFIIFMTGIVSVYIQITKVILKWIIPNNEKEEKIKNEIKKLKKKRNGYNDSKIRSEIEVIKINADIKDLTEERELIIKNK